MLECRVFACRGDPRGRPVEPGFVRENAVNLRLLVKAGYVSLLESE